MHPQIILDHADLCPLCGMDLTPVVSGGGGWEEEDPGVRLVLSPAARKMADVGSVEIGLRELFKEIRTVGKVDFDETRVADVAARLRGPIQQVFADFPGTLVRQGDRLVSIFATEVYPGQQEYLFTRGQEAVAQKQFPGSTLNKFYLPRRRLEYWGMTKEQIEALGSRQEAQDYLVVSAPISGTIVEKKVRLGQFVQEGEILYTIADLSQVWLVLDVYESELSWLRLGQQVEITLESAPQRPMTGQVGFIEAVLNEATRSVRVRVILENPGGRLKPGMYAQALLRVPILADGSAAASGLEGKYFCPLHPWEVAEEKG
jgi:multidrug efflux pump subunit AcrA (membrane-fusion protein)